MRSPDDRDLAATDLEAAKKEAELLLSGDATWDGPLASIVDEGGRVLATRPVDSRASGWMAGDTAPL